VIGTHALIRRERKFGHLGLLWMSSMLGVMQRYN